VNNKAHAVSAHCTCSALHVQTNFSVVRAN